MSDIIRREMRTFLAIPLSEALKQSISEAQKALDGKVSGVRWVKPDNLHLTLRFFGATTQEDLEKIRVSMLSVERIQQPFVVDVKGLGAFPTPKRPRVLWLGLKPRAPLQELFRICQSELQQAGIPPEERVFAPHLTIGRLRQHVSELGTLIENYAASSFGELPVRQIILYESRLHRHGAEHIPLNTIKLSGTDLPEQ